MRKVLLLSFIMVSCASPNVWVISQWSGGGVIGYQNYNPSNDGGVKIRQKLQCLDHMMTANPLKFGYTQPSVYSVQSVGSTNFVTAVDGGQYEWREYHYTCNQKNSNSQNSSNNRISSNECGLSCKSYFENGQLAAGVSIEECVRMSCY